MRAIVIDRKAEKHLQHEQGRDQRHRRRQARKQRQPGKARRQQQAADEDLRCMSGKQVDDRRAGDRIGPDGDRGAKAGAKQRGDGDHMDVDRNEDPAIARPRGVEVVGRRGEIGDAAGRDVEDEKGPLFWSGPVLAGGRLWLTNTNGEVYTVDAATGAASPFADLDKPISLAPVVANNTLYVLDDSGRITAFR